MSTVAHEREYMSVAEAAMLLGVSAPTIRRKIATGELPAVRLGDKGSSIRIPRAELEAWLYAPPGGRPAA
jgi:excisionase family DNA binding protein